MIGTAAHVAEVGKAADGVIIGSRLVRAADEGGGPAGAAEAVGAFLAEARVAVEARIARSETGAAPAAAASADAADGQT